MADLRRAQKLQAFCRTEWGVSPSPVALASLVQDMEDQTSRESVIRDCVGLMQGGMEFERLRRLLSSHWLPELLAAKVRVSEVYNAQRVQAGL